jgi:tetratricopeptide (TPR) repeat protein
MAGAQAQFERAIKADPAMAEAHYQLAMTLINQGKIAEALPPLEQYLSLAPSGPNAETAKMMLPELQKMTQ